jgi:hypothetical protein
VTKLTQEQIKTLEDAFNSLPEDMRTGTYRTMEGIGRNRRTPHKQKVSHSTSNSRNSAN